MKPFRYLCSALAIMLSIASLHGQEIKPDLILEGKIEGTQNKTYFEVPFEVPVRSPSHKRRLHLHGQRQENCIRSRHRRSATLSRQQRRQQEPFHDQRIGRNAVLSCREPSCPANGSCSFQCRTFVRRKSLLIGQRYASTRLLKIMPSPSSRSRPEGAGIAATCTCTPLHSDGSCPSQSGKNCPVPRLPDRKDCDRARARLHRDHRSQR